jgi:hypothetical protein
MKKKGGDVKNYVGKPWKSFLIRSGGEGLGNEQLIRDFSKYGTVVGIERKSDNSVLVEYFYVESLDLIRENIEYLKKLGYDVEVKRKGFKKQEPRKR